MDSNTLALIRELNLAYLLLVQRLIQEEERATDTSHLGVTAEMAGVLAALSLGEINRLAAVPQLLCKFHFRAHTALSALADQQGRVGETGAPQESEPAEKYA